MKTLFEKVMAKNNWMSCDKNAKCTVYSNIKPFHIE